MSVPCKTILLTGQLLFGHYLVHKNIPLCLERYLFLLCCTNVLCSPTLLLLPLIIMCAVLHNYTLTYSILHYYWCPLLSTCTVVHFFYTKLPVAIQCYRNLLARHHDCGINILLLSLFCAGRFTISGGRNV
jgi:hypothetical protein